MFRITERIKRARALILPQRAPIRGMALIVLSLAGVNAGCWKAQTCEWRDYGLCAEYIQDVKNDEMIKFMEPDGMGDLKENCEKQGGKLSDNDCPDGGQVGVCRDVESEFMRDALVNYYYYASDWSAAEFKTNCKQIGGTPD